MIELVANLPFWHTGDSNSPTMQTAASTVHAFSFWKFMDAISAAAELTDQQRERIARAAEKHRGERFSVTPRLRPAEAQIAFAARCLADRMSRGEVAAALQARFGVCRTAAYARVRKALDNRRPAFAGVNPTPPLSRRSTEGRSAHGCTREDHHDQRRRDCGQAAG